MPGNKYTIKQGATWPSIQANLSINKEGMLNGANVQFVMADISGNPVLKTDATIDDADAGIISYTLTTTDTQIAGTFWVEFWITFADGSLHCEPVDEYILIDIKKNLLGT